MSDHFEHNPKDHEDPLAAPTWLVGFISTVLLVVIFLGVTALFYSADDEEEALKAFTVEPLDLEIYRLQQQARIDRPARVEITIVDDVEDDRRVVIPIEDAMQRIAMEAQSP